MYSKESGIMAKYKQEREITINLHATIQDLKKIRQMGEEMARQHGIEEDRIFEYVLCIDEIFSNCIIHAYKGIGGRVTVTFVFEEQGLMTRITDDGIGIPEAFTYKSQRVEIPDLACSGRGLFLVENLSDGLWIKRCEVGGTQVDFYFGRMCSK